MPSHDGVRRFPRREVLAEHRPGIGVTLDMAQLDAVAEYSTPGGGNNIYQRRDGSPSHW